MLSGATVRGALRSTAAEVWCGIKGGCRPRLASTRTLEAIHRMWPNPRDGPNSLPRYLPGHGGQNESDMGYKRLHYHRYAALTTPAVVSIFAVLTYLVAASRGPGKRTEIPGGPITGLTVAFLATQVIVYY
jgi:hypothetical protein